MADANSSKTDLSRRFESGKLARSRLISCLPSTTTRWPPRQTVFDATLLHAIFLVNCSTKSLVEDVLNGHIESGHNTRRSSYPSKYQAMVIPVQIVQRTHQGYFRRVPFRTIPKSLCPPFDVVRNLGRCVSICRILNKQCYSKRLSTNHLQECINDNNHSSAIAALLIVPWAALPTLARAVKFESSKYRPEYAQAGARCR